MKKNIFLKIICILFIIFALFCSSQLAFASDDSKTYSFSFTGYDDIRSEDIFMSVSVTGSFSSDEIPVLIFLNHRPSVFYYQIFTLNLSSGKINPNQYFSVTGYITINGSRRDYNISSSNRFGFEIGNFHGVSMTGCYIDVSDITFSNIATLDNYTFNKSMISNIPLSVIDGNNYDKNGFTNYSSDIYYPVPMSISYCNDVEDLVNYDRFYISFNILPENCRYSNTSFYDLELWVLNSDKRIFVNSYPLSGLQYQTHSGGGSWGADSGGKVYYVLDEKLHDSISFLDELESPLILEFRLVYRINDTSYLESGYVDVTVDLASGTILSVDYYDDGMKEDDVVNENPEVLPEVVQPSNPNGYIFNIDWDNSNLDEFVKQNFGIKNYIIALKDTLSFLPEFFWTMQFFLLGVISAIGIYKLVIT